MASSKASKQRRHQRIKQESEATLKALRAAGASCGNCSCFERSKPYPDAGFSTWCDLKSGSDGYCPVKATDICEDHAPASNKTPSDVAQAFFSRAMRDLGFPWNDRRSGQVKTMLANGYSVEQIGEILIPPAAA